MIAERAPAKVNLVLQVGRRRDDGLHGLCSLFAPLELADELSFAEATHDEVICPEVEGPNLVNRALEAFRRRVPLPPLRVEIDKRIPVAGGLGGGSADAAAALRAANRIAGNALGIEDLRALAAGIGADVPSQVQPAPALVTGAGERVEQLDLEPVWLVLAPSRDGLSTAAVYEELDRLHAGRETLDPDSLRALAGVDPVRLAAASENDLEPAALSLRPELHRTLVALSDQGALAARLSGSGPTAFGLFPDQPTAESAAEALPDAVPTPTTGPV